MMGHIQHLFFESLVKMDHFQKEPPLNLKWDHLGKGIGNPALYPPKADIGRWPDRRLNSSGVRIPSLHSEGSAFTQSRGGACTGIFSFQQMGRSWPSMQ